MNDEELEKIWRGLDTRIETINKRTKIHTIKIKELEVSFKHIQEHVKTIADLIKLNDGVKTCLE